MCTRQTSCTGPLSSASVGKKNPRIKFAECPGSRHSANTSALPSARDLALGKGLYFAECFLYALGKQVARAHFLRPRLIKKPELTLPSALDLGTRQTLVLCRVPAKKLVKDMHYEARVEAIIDFYAEYKRMRIKKEEARTMNLTKEEFMAVPPWWCRSFTRCWEKMVDVWLQPGWLENHNACRERRLQMPYASHHQGSLSLDEYKEKWTSSHDGQGCSRFKAWVMSKKGKATADIDFNPEDPPEAYSHPSIHSRVTEYTAMAREVHGPEFDPSSQDIDPEIVMRVGGGKKHGRYWIGDSVIDTASTPTLSQIRARSTDSSPAIRPRPTAAQLQMQALQAQVEVERKRREELEARIEADRQLERQRTEQMFQYMQSVFHSLGQTPPPMPPNLFPPPPPPPAATPNQSAASNAESSWGHWTPARPPHPPQ
ncbi:uncharacterized protein [Setaria viridis]|uniref:uncharacterized protein isoform X2 n=2 Tax=Setaria viridis TaxID=4556 RepID=UPI003B3A7B79